MPKVIVEDQILSAPPESRDEQLGYQIYTGEAIPRPEEGEEVMSHC